MASQGGMLSGEPLLQNPVSLFLVQSTIVVGFCQALSMSSINFGKWRQPAVVLEIIGGIILGPSALGRNKDYLESIFPIPSQAHLSLVANVGLILYLFTVGMELDPKLLLEHGKRAGGVAAFGIAVPFAFGIAISRVMFDTLQGQDSRYGPVNITSFYVFIGTAMSITAFPVLARILKEGGLLYTKPGVLAIGAAAIDDATAWCLLALDMSIAHSANYAIAAYVFLSVFTFALGMLLIVRRPFHWFVAYVESYQSNSMSNSLLALSVCLLFVSAWTTAVLGVHFIFGAFVFGLIVPRKSRLFLACKDAIDDLVEVFFLPLYFALSGLQTDITQLRTSYDWLMVLLVCTAALVGKFLGAGGAAWASGLPLRDSAVVAVLMNTRGLIELIVLNVGLQAGILNTRTFSVMVIMCLFTTFITAPILVCIYPVSIREREEREPPADVGGSEKPLGGDCQGAGGGSRNRDGEERGESDMEGGADAPECDFSEELLDGREMKDESWQSSSGRAVAFRRLKKHQQKQQQDQQKQEEEKEDNKDGDKDDDVFGLQCMAEQLRLGIVLDRPEGCQLLMNLVARLSAQRMGSELAVTLMKLVEPTRTVRDEFIGMSTDGRLVRVESHTIEQVHSPTLKTSNSVQETLQCLESKQQRRSHTTTQAASSVTTAFDGMREPCLRPVSMLCQAIGAAVEAYSMVGDPVEFPAEIRMLLEVHRCNALLLPWREGPYVGALCKQLLQQSLQVPVMLLVPMGGREAGGWQHGRGQRGILSSAKTFQKFADSSKSCSEDASLAGWSGKSGCGAQEMGSQVMAALKTASHQQATQHQQAMAGGSDTDSVATAATAAAAATTAAATAAGTTIAIDPCAVAPPLRSDNPGDDVGHTATSGARRDKDVTSRDRANSFGGLRSTSWASQGQLESHSAAGRVVRSCGALYDGQRQSKPEGRPQRGPQAEPQRLQISQAPIFSRSGRTGGEGRFGLSHEDAFTGVGISTVLAMLTGDPADLSILALLLRLSSQGTMRIDVMLPAREGLDKRAVQAVDHLLRVECAGRVAWIALPAGEAGQSIGCLQEAICGHLWSRGGADLLLIGFVRSADHAVGGTDSYLFDAGSKVTPSTSSGRSNNTPTRGDLESQQAQQAPERKGSESSEAAILGALGDQLLRIRPAVPVVAMLVMHMPPCG